MNLTFSTRLIGTACLCAVLSGCGILSGAGPYSSSITTEAGSNSQLPYEVIDLGPSTLAPYAVAAPQSPSNKVSKVVPYAVRLVPGDVISVLISDSATEGGLFAPLSMGGTKFSNVRIDAQGRISLPYAGRIHVNQLTLPQVEAEVRKRLEGKAMDPQVHIEMVGDLSGSVLVAGAVKTPGRYSALQGPLTLLDAINMAGGPLLEPHLTSVTIRTGKSVKTLNYAQVLNGQNMPVAPRSEIVVERARKRFVAMGSVVEPGLHDLPSERPSLLEALGVVGGLKEQAADPSGVFIFRRTQTDTGEPRAQVFRLNMRNPESIFIAGQFAIQPEDAIYVTNAAVYEWQKIITPIVQTLILSRAF
ncbi:sugar transporter [Bordetella genomosp. 7]|jgi:polysaccharide export outer membrane protein|uniref:Sugar transporter n=1 Tax=Bordetella genomosp. 7 TaxID=1416805 RepID=A0A261RBY7_9BORD|nr:MULTISPECIES: polysaccharide biosynthesis/export family protein [Bordetella]OZI22451.1 sugar transporter [Bordetella genomosp. 7]OZI27153.1 sugar transporter [Bordetella genomosp. 7]